MKHAFQGLAASGLIALTYSPAALSADHNTYIGLSFGQSQYSTGVSNLTGTAAHDKKDQGYKLYGGYNFNKHIALEGHYADFGTTSLSGNTGDTFTHDGTTYAFTANNVKLTSDARSAGLSGKFSYPVTNHFSPYAKLGLHYWQDEGSAASAASGYNSDDDGVDLMFGLGFDVRLTDNLSARLEAERFKFDNDELDFISVGLQYNF